MVRPVRVGLVFEPSADMLRFAVEQATLLWGGQFQPIFQPSDIGWVEETSRALGVDVLLALDRAAVSERTAALDGFRWLGREGWGPLAPAQDYVNHRLLGPERLLDDLPRDSRVLPEWADGDPLDDMFRVWFGAYGTSVQGVGLQNRFAAGAVKVSLDEGGEVPAGVSSWITPIAATCAGIDYKGESPGAVFVVVDPFDPASLAAFWNARACGAAAFPIPMGHEKRVLAGAGAFLRQVLEEGRLGRWTTADGRPVGPRIYVWQAAGADDLPAALAELLAGHGVTPMIDSPESGLELVRGWSGEHPFTTSYALDFSQPLEEEGRVARIAVPVLGGGFQNNGAPHGSIVALHVNISAAVGVRPDWTFSVPGKRSYADLLRKYDGVLLNFERPVEDGRALSVFADAREVTISAVPSIAIIDRFLDGPGWSACQTPGGIFVTRFIDRLGGAGSTVANQPGARAALLRTVRSQRGLASGAIVQAIKKEQGSWPGLLGGDRDGYPSAVFRFFLRQAILRPVLPVDCPYCTSSVAHRPEDLTGQMKCEMCLREFPLGLALGTKVNGRNDWLYQVAGHVGSDRLSEALPVMATLQVLCSRSYERGAMIPYVLGWAVKGPGLDCEIDIAAVMGYRGVPALVIGEVKSWQDSIDVNDLSNLKRVQDHIRSQGTECFILAAVMRELRDDERDALRNLAQQPPNSVMTGSALEPVLPIVLTGRNLSAEWAQQSHPNHWSPADGVLGLAKESCRVNLGMTGLEPDPASKDFRFRPLWSAPTPAPVSDPSR